MGNTDQRSLRGILRREIAGTIGLLADEQDFAAMRRYRSFVFDDHTTYLRQMEALLRTRAAQGGHTSVILFDPQEYEFFCADIGLDPDAAASRLRYTAELATAGPAVAYEGQPFSELVPALVDEVIHQATWEYASTVLAHLGPCACCGADLGRAAFTRATELVLGILDTAGPGERHLVCSVAHDPEPLVAALHSEYVPGGGDDDVDDGRNGDDIDIDDVREMSQLEEAQTLRFITVLALGLATHGGGGLVVRAREPGGTDRVFGWQLRDARLVPLSAGEVFDAYCTDASSGDLISPESDVDYCTPPDLGDTDRPAPHIH